LDVGSGREVSTADWANSRAWLASEVEAHLIERAKERDRKAEVGTAAGE
jgi:hypothetical protein